MAKPSTAPTAFASAATYSGTSGVPAALVGTSVRISAPASFYDHGFVPSGTIKSQWLNTTLGLAVDWAIWVNEAQSTLARSQHLVETTTNGKTAVQYLTVGDGSGGAFTSDNAIVMVADGTKYGLLGTNGAVNALQLLHLTSSSTTAGPARIETTAASKTAVEAVATSGSAVSGTATSGTGLTGSSTTGAGIIGSTASAGQAGVRGSGAGIGVEGIATAAGGTGVSGTTAGGGLSTDNGVRGVGLGDGVGVGASAVDGNAIRAAATGDQDVIVALASGTGAALRMNPQTLPAVERIGQMWTELVDSNPNLATFKVMANDTGLASPGGLHIWAGADPLTTTADITTGTINVAEGAVLAEIGSLVVRNFYGSSITVWIEAHFSAVINTAGTIPLATALTPVIFDLDTTTTIASDVLSLASTTTKLSYFVGGTYALPGTGTTTIKLYLSVAGGGAGSVDISRRSIRVITASGGLNA